MRHSSNWVIVTVRRPLVWMRGDRETWTLNPRRRYILNSGQLSELKDDIDTVSDLLSSPNYKKLNPLGGLYGKRVLVERFRERGLGDLIFLTGIFAWLKEISIGTAHIDTYALKDRGQVFTGCPFLDCGSALLGPMEYDALKNYDYHWFIETVTEFVEEKDQANVYDALYLQLGVDPQAISAKFKRPQLFLTPGDQKLFASLTWWLKNNGAEDLNQVPYYVVAPTSNSTLRNASFVLWAELIEHLAETAPVVVVGQSSPKIRPAGITFEEFQARLDGIQNRNVINMTQENMDIRALMTVIAKASAVVSLDSGPLYIAQGFRVPAVSIWGTHNPAVRLGYDQDYLDLAIFNKDACPHAPCYAYSGFPEDKCPQGEATKVCQPLLSVRAQQVVDKLKLLKSRHSFPRPLSGA